MCHSQRYALAGILDANLGVIHVNEWHVQGSGQSDGKYVTLGWREQDDLALAIQHLRSLGTVSTIGLWGRSMGAVTALLYSQRDPSIAGVVRC